MGEWVGLVAQCSIGSRPIRWRPRANKRPTVKACAVDHRKTWHGVSQIRNARCRCHPCPVPLEAIRRQGFGAAWRPPDDRRRLRKARGASRLAELVVATDDERIAGVIQGIGGKALMTSADHPSGHRPRRRAAAAIEADVVVNIQGDEPFISGEGDRPGGGAVSRAGRSPDEYPYARRRERSDAPRPQRSEGGGRSRGFCVVLLHAHRSRSPAAASGSRRGSTLDSTPTERVSARIRAG